MNSLQTECLSFFLITLGSFAAFSNMANAQGGKAQPTLPTVTLNLDGKELITEIANTPDQRYMGLSFRKTLADNEAMLFVYPQEQPLTITIRNT